MRHLMLAMMSFLPLYSFTPDCTIIFSPVTTTVTSSTDRLNYLDIFHHSRGTTHIDAKELINCLESLQSSTYANTANTLVRRDALGNFFTNDIGLTGNLTVTGSTVFHQGTQIGRAHV